MYYLNYLKLKLGLKIKSKNHCILKKGKQGDYIITNPSGTLVITKNVLKRILRENELWLISTKWWSIYHQK